MDFFTWLARISQSSAPPGQAFTPQGWYVALTLVIPLLMGVILAGILRVLEKLLGVRLGGGSV